jgi:hypothetical protein
MTGPNGTAGEDAVAAVMRLTDLAGKVERVEQASTRRLDELARDCAAAMDQLTGLRADLGTLAGRADRIEQRLTSVNALLKHMSGQIAALTTPAGETAAKDDGGGYQVNPAPPWWRPDDQRCQDTAARLADWVDDVYRPVFGYLADLLAACWARHPLCLAYLDTLHEAWCLLYLSGRDPKMVFAQLDWLTRALLQAADVMATETRSCREAGQHRDPARPGATAAVPAWLTPGR